MEKGMKRMEVQRGRDDDGEDVKWLDSKDEGRRAIEYQESSVWIENTVEDGS